jgi:hypothetical protein
VKTPNPKLQALRLERFRMHAALFALGVVLGAYQAAKSEPKSPSSVPPSPEVAP